jgi:hypothetical protein
MSDYIRNKNKKPRPTGSDGAFLFIYLLKRLFIEFQIPVSETVAVFFTVVFIEVVQLLTNFGCPPVHPAGVLLVFVLVC